MRIEPFDEDLITVEEIKEDNEEKAEIISVFAKEDGTIGFYSHMEPLETARIFTVLATYILKEEQDGANARTHRFFGHR